MKIIAICQPHFFPWIGYFNMIYNCDEFIFLDNVQFNRRSWQNRTYIKHFKTGEKKWLSMSLLKPSRSLKINELNISEENLPKFKNQLYENYKNTKYFDKYYKFFISILEKNINKDLSNINIHITKEICKILDINIKFKLSSEFNISEKKENLILQLLKKNNCSNYLANSGSKNYIDKNFFKINKIQIKFHDYNYPKYLQLKKNKDDIFLDGLSVMDVIFNIGDESSKLVKKQKINFDEDFF